jgi:predicted PurR-regulated permease PerM
LTVIIAILIGAELLGVAGMFIAVPIAAALRVFILHALPRPASVSQAQPALTRGPRDDVEGPPKRPAQGAPA